jgi:thioredoxin 1
VKRAFFSVLIFFWIFFPVGAGLWSKENLPQKLPAIPVKGMPTLVDIGANLCIPCKMMEPILEKLQKTYKGKAAILFIDIYDHREVAKSFKIQAIPTQIFYDRSGQEVYRHVGFMSEKAIVTQFKKMGLP